MAGTVTQTTSKTGGNVKLITFTATADASDGSYPNTDMDFHFSGRLIALETQPGSPAPDANYDIVLDNEDDYDILEGVGQNRSTGSDERVAIVFSGTSIHPPFDISETLTLKITGNSTNSAVTIIKLYVAEGA